MSSDFQVKRRIIGRTSDWIKRFDVSEYVQNPPLIEKLHEEKQLALSHTLDLEIQISKLSEKNHELELQNQKLMLQYDEQKHRSSYIFALSIIAGITASIGANIATGEPYGWVGWIMIAVAVALEIAAFWMTPK